ncbi:TPA: hypothetical protein P2Q96_001707 [Aeromonas veronii]|nr:hypothetical protein [Aeromonas veronii]
MNVNKTLVALAVAASAMVSGSAMAWSQNSGGGTFEMSGSISPVARAVPWEVKLGKVGLDVNVGNLSGKEISHKVTGGALVVGVRSVGRGFIGQAVGGITPQVKYGVAFNGAFKDSVTTLTLNMLDKTDKSKKLGVVEMPLFSYGEVKVIATPSVTSPSEIYHEMLYAAKAGDAFYGALPTAAGGVLGGDVGRMRITSVDSSVTSTFNTVRPTTPAQVTFRSKFDKVTDNFSGFYGGVIEKDAVVKFKLENNLTAKLDWTASLPITLTYM